METKICKQCKIEKQLADFSKGKAVCKTCRNIKNRQYYREKKELRNKPKVEEQNIQSTKPAVESGLFDCYLREQGIQIENINWDVIKSNINYFGFTRLYGVDVIYQRAPIPNSGYNFKNYMRIPDDELDWLDDELEKREEAKIDHQEILYEKKKERNKEKLQCECGALISSGYKNEHCKTKTHQNFLKSKE